MPSNHEHLEYEMKGLTAYQLISVIAELYISSEMNRVNVDSPLRIFPLRMHIYYMEDHTPRIDLTLGYLHAMETEHSRSALLNTNIDTGSADFAKNRGSGRLELLAEKIVRSSGQIEHVAHIEGRDWVRGNNPAGENKDRHFEFPESPGALSTNLLSSLQALDKRFSWPGYPEAIRMVLNEFFHQTDLPIDPVEVTHEKPSAADKSGDPADGKILGLLQETIGRQI